MKREIKFRAFYAPEKTMIYFSTLRICDEYSSISFYSKTPKYDGYDRLPNAPRNGNIDYNAFDEDWTLMQFIGIRDKNGKEIYEGDIYKIDKNKGTWIIVYHECAFKMVEKSQFNQGEKCPQNDFPLITFINKKHIEIIGNIYENPELLIEDKIKDPEYYPMTLLLNINDKCPLE